MISTTIKLFKKAFLQSLIFIFSLLFFGLHAQTREGSINLASSEGRAIYFNDDKSGSSVGVESGSFTVEAWVRMTSNGNNDFTLFTINSGNQGMSLAWTEDNWKVEAVSTEESSKYGSDGSGDKKYHLVYNQSGFSGPTWLNEWHHVAFVCYRSSYSGSKKYLYIDGELAYKDSSYDPYLILEDGGDGDCVFGGDDRIGDDDEGKIHLAEARVWKTARSSSEIQQNYQHEVNSDDSDWNNLVRYYHGNESTGSGSSRTFEDRSPTSEYDATVSNSDVDVTTSNGYTPPVGPPHLESNSSLYSFSAKDCDTDDDNITITISGLNSGYTVLDPGYSVTNLSTGVEVGSGKASSSTINLQDNTVSREDKVSYELRAYYQYTDANGVTQTVYSNDNPSGVGEITDDGSNNAPYAAPSLTASTDNCDKSIDLSWTSSDGTPDQWKIEKSFTSNFGTIEGNATLDGDILEYTFNNQDVETDIYYRLTATGTDNNGCTVTGATTSVLGLTSYPPNTPTNATITQDLSNQSLKLAWSNPGGNNADSWVIKRSKFDGSSEVEFTTVLGTTNYEDGDLELCETYSYTLGAVNECATNGAFATTDLTGNISTDLSDAISTMEASKGYLTDAVQVEWSLNGSLSSIDRFRLYRSKAESNNFSLIKVLDNDLIYIDETALGGVFYNYKVVGEAACEDNTIYTNEGVDMGFVIPYGVANGHIEYDGGNAVEGVTVNFEKQSEDGGNSLEFDGVDDYVLIDEEVQVDNRSFTIEFWEKRTKNSRGFVLGSSVNPNVVNNTLYLGYASAGSFIFAFHANDLSVTSTYDNEWHHWACVYDKDAKGDNRYIYKDGVLVASNESTSDFLGTAPLAMGYVHRNPYFKGYVDEVRIWDIARSAEEIAENYNSLLNGSEEGLITYYRCDEGFGSDVFDASQTDDEYNKHDGTFINEVAFSDDVPSSSQLGIKGVTDEYGDYTLSYIPYAGSGETFRVTPSFGQHTFEPNSRTVYIGDGAQTQNNLDFTDISSFTVTGKVTYQNTNVPVEGVSVLLDGYEVLGDDNQVIRTDENGDYEINVPIGKHYLSVSQDGHVFAEGYFPPLDSYGSIAKYEFVEDLTVNFTDSTKVKIAGRIVGGEIEGNKTIGFDLSTNNIGVADLEFKLLKEGYDIDTEDANIYDLITLTTDPYSGEYEIELIPESWVIQKAGNDAYFIEAGDLSVLDLSNSLNAVTVTNTDESGLTESYSYHHLLNHIIREQPIITVTNEQYEAFDGDTVITFVNQVTSEVDTLILGSQSIVDFPVFQMGKNYTAVVNVNEYYTNLNHPNGAVYDQVAVEGATVTIVDNLSILPGSASGETNANGEIAYDFIAGVPSLTENGDESYTKSFEVYATIDGTAIDWVEDYHAYVLGSSPLEGTDFVSSGPDVPEIILRDPPGSNSYAYIEKGSTFSEATSYLMQTSSTSALDLNVMSGVTVEFGGGLAGPVVEAQVTNNTTAGLSVMEYYDEEGVYSRDVTFTERIETSDDPDDVGSPADLYIGKSYNIFYTKSKNFKILPTDFCIENGLTYVGDSNAEYCLGMIDGFVINDDGASTYFVYSQRHILNELIPNLFELRNSLLLTAEYTSHLTVGSPYYGMNNDDPSLENFIADTLAQNPAADTTELVYSYTGTETDQIRFYNSQITLWLNAIAINEAEKASADVVRNISIDGTAGSFTSEIEEVYSSENNYFHSRDVFVNYDQEFGAFVNDNGASISVSGDLGYAVSSGGSSGTSNSLLFGYVIEDEDESDYYSIDVLKSDGVTVFADNDFSNNSANSGDYVTDLTGTNSDKSVLGNLTENIAESVVYSTNAVSTGVGVANTIGTQIYNMVDMSKNALDLDEKIDANSKYDISGFKISSPIFAVRGGQTKCPYQDEEYASFYVDAAGETPLLNTGTIQREVPIIDVSPSIRNNVPDNQDATFTLQLQNGNDVLGEFYEIMIDESTNPDGLELLIDGLTAERAFYIDPASTVEKTMTVRKTKDDVMDYDSIAVIFKSTCQYDPTNAAADIGDTVFISVHFLPSCADVEITSFDENWILNYEDNDEGSVTLAGYDLNLSTLEKIDFQYKTLSGSPISVMSWFVDTTSTAYLDYNGAKDILETSDVSFNWDISSLTDRGYQLRARAVCTDASVTESDYLTGVIDRTTPTVFGTPTPTDGILDPSDDVMIKFNEELESGLVMDHNITVRGVLNGANVSHNTAVQFNGVNEYGRIPAISFNNKPFTVEYWLQRDAGSAGTVFSKGSGDDQFEIVFNTDETISLTVGTQTFSVNPTSYYTSVTPVDSWHHWGVAYDNIADEVILFMDDQLLHTESNVIFSPRNAENAFVGSSVSGENYLEAQIHELRIWEDALTVSESAANMNETLSGSELGLYGYWTMDEGNGTQALDKTAGRHISLDAQWSLSPGSDAYAFNGSSQYLILDGSNVALGNETNFTLEFWFKAATPSSTQTIFSSGKGDLSDTITGSSEYALSVNFLPSGKIEVVSNGETFEAVSTNYFDSQWHHFALVVDRQATVKSFIDGALQKSTTTTGIQGVAGNELWLGARGFKADPSSTTFDQYFAGSIDEFRIWNSNRSADYIELYKNSKLTGDEAGLVAYLPFESYTEVQGTIIRSTTLSDEATPQFTTQASPAIAVSGESFVSGASIRDVRPVQDIPFDFVVNNDEIIITPLIDANRIERQTIEFSVNNVYDLNGNRQLSTASWTAYVQQNELIWENSVISLTYQPGESAVFTASINNIGGTDYSYDLENLPSWLSTTDASGSVAPNASKDITFTINEGLNVGYYEQSINLSTVLDFNEKLTIQVSVEEEAPDWSVDTDKFEYSMNLFGQLFIKDIASTDENDMVGVFVDDESRGYANVEYIEALDGYLVFVTVYSNSNELNTESLELRVWDASEAQIYEEVTPELTFAANAIIGTSSNPQEINTSNTIATTIQLNEGWTWVSFNMETSKLATVDSIFTNIGATNDLVKSQNAFDIYDEATGWLGNLTLLDGGLQIEEMYKVYVANGGNVKYSGTPVNTFNTSIAIASGWNYIGYTPQVSMTIEEAFVTLNPQTGDLVKSQSKFSMYDQILGWVGSLKTLTPNQGYMLYSNNTATLTYPENSSLSSAKTASATAVKLPENWNLNIAQYPDNMTLIAEIEFDYGFINVDEDILLVYVDDEPRGFAIPEELPTGEVVYFTSIYGTSEETLRFELYNQISKEKRAIDNGLTYATNEIVGELNNPFTLRISSNKEWDNELNFSVVPNPFVSTLYLNLACEESVFSLYGATGNLILINKVKDSGKIELNIDVPAGAYILKVDSPCGVFTEKLIKY